MQHLPDPIDIDEDVDPDEIPRLSNLRRVSNQPSQSVSRPYESEADRIDFLYDNINKFERNVDLSHKSISQ